MPVFVLTDELVFPDPSQAEPDGLLALGGDLRPERLLLAYAHGIFPWNGEDEPLLWWSPAPRAVLVPGEIEVPRSLAKAIRRRPYRISLDLAFEEVVAGCAETPRPGQDRTWITAAIRGAFVDMHRRGLAHSVEAWDGDRLVGGLYGLALGTVFCGESMFARADDASKIAFVALCEQLRRWEFTMIDCQVETAHLRRFGATPIERPEFMRRLVAGIERPWRVGVWTLDQDLAGRSEGGPPPRQAPPPVMWKMSRETGARKRRGTGRGEVAMARGTEQEAVRGGEAQRGAGEPAPGRERVDMSRETGATEAEGDASGVAPETGGARESEGGASGVTRGTGGETEAEGGASGMTPETDGTKLQGGASGGTPGTGGATESGGGAGEMARGTGGVTEPEGGASDMASGTGGVTESGDGMASGTGEGGKGGGSKLG